MMHRDSYLGKIVRWLVLASLLIVPCGAFGQGFEEGYQAFLSGDYRKARVYLIRGIKRSQDRYDKALMFKLLGISEYKLGRRKKAAGHFKRALKLDPTVRITSEESRDRRVRKLFAYVKRKTVRGGDQRRGRRSQRMSRSRRARMMAMRQQSSGGSPILSFIPFGVGHFIQGKALTGSLLALGQATGLALYFERTQAANQADQDALEVINEFESDTSDLDQASFDQYLNDNEAFVLAARQEATYGLALLSAVYTAGVLEAYLFSPEPMAPRRRRRAAVERAEDKLQPNEQLDDLYLADYRPPTQPVQFHLQLDDQAPRGILSFKLEF
jgi:tetratricopeptide (TPR) repeat protein